MTDEEPKKPNRPRMLQFDFEEFLADKERQIKKPPVPPKRRQPKITRHMSPQQRIALQQTPNPIRAIYTPEHERNQTPTNDDLVGTNEVGPGDVHNNVYRAGKATIESPTGYVKRRYPTRRTGQRGRPAQDMSELMSEYDDL